LGREAAKAITIKASTNSRQPKNLAILDKDSTNHPQAKKSIKQETIKMAIYKGIIFQFYALQ